MMFVDLNHLQLMKALLSSENLEEFRALRQVTWRTCCELELIFNWESQIHSWKIKKLKKKTTIQQQQVTPSKNVPSVFTEAKTNWASTHEDFWAYDFSVLFSSWFSFFSVL